jgi:nitronate monooxygenase
VQAPLAGGASTPQLAAAVASAGGLGFLAAGYKTAEAVAADIRELRELSDAPFGVKAMVVRRLHESGSDVWVTVTSPDEAELAAAAGADALVVQGLEAGGHRGGFTDPPRYEEFGLLSLLRLVAERVPVPQVTSGGIAGGAAVAAALAAGAAAGQIGTALLLAPEARTAPAYREALTQERATALTGAFSGRRARGIVNRFMVEHEAAAPVAYPDIHHLTTPIRAAAREAGDAEAINLWAGQTHTLATDAPAAEIVRALVAGARASAAAAAARLGAD